MSRSTDTAVAAVSSQVCAYCCAGRDGADATSSPQQVPDYAAGLPQASSLSSRPLAGKRAGVIRETLGPGVAEGVSAAFRRAVQHLESMGATVEEVKGCSG